MPSAFSLVQSACRNARQVLPALRRVGWRGTVWLVLAGVAAPPPAGAQVASAEGTDELLVLAASSLTDVLPRVAAEWSIRSGVAVRFSFDATSRLAPQATSGAPADVFVAADEAWIRWLGERGTVDGGAARVVASNELVLAVPRGSSAPGESGDLGGLAFLALGGENVPAGRYGRQALMNVGAWGAVQDRIVTGGSVRGVLEWVARGEVPAGIVYRTDAMAEPAVEVAFAFDSESHEPIEYWAAPLVNSRARELAVDLIDFMAGPVGGSIFQEAGFAPAGASSEGLPPLAAAGQERAVPAAPLPSVSSAIRLSFLIALLATLVGLVPAIGLGWVLARKDFRGKAILSTAVLAPLVLPPVVTGFLLLSLLGTQSPVGAMLASLGLRVPFSVIGATIAAFTVGLPLYVLSIRGAFEAVDPLYEELSWTLGVAPRKTFFRVSLPLALPGIAAGAVLAFARALGEFGATVVLAGNIEGDTRTIALAVYTLLEAPSGRETTWILVGASVVISLLALLGFEELSRRQRRRLDDDHAR